MCVESTHKSTILNGANSLATELSSATGQLNQRLAYNHSKWYFIHDLKTLNSFFSRHFKPSLFLTHMATSYESCNQSNIYIYTRRQICRVILISNAQTLAPSCEHNENLLNKMPLCSVSIKT